MIATQAQARGRAATRTALVLATVIAVDQLTKHTLGTWIRPGQVRHVIPGVELVYERNAGVAFSILSGSGALVYVVTAAAVTALGIFMLRQPQRRLIWLPTGMLVGGALGNVIDRVGRGSVIDFIKLPHWPAFNFADMSITFGVIILVLVIEFSPGRADGS